jgi:hypothetical protein
VSVIRCGTTAVFGSEGCNPDEVGVASDALVGDRPDAVLRAIDAFVTRL